MTLHNFTFVVLNDMNNYRYLFQNVFRDEKAKVVTVKKDKYIYKRLILSFTVNTPM